MPSPEPTPTPNIDKRLGVSISFSLSEYSRGGVAGTEDDVALGGENTFSRVGVVADLAFLRGARFSLTSSLGSSISRSESSSRLPSSGARVAVGMKGADEVRRIVGMNIMASWYTAKPG